MINSSVAFQVNYIPPEIASSKCLSITAKYVFSRIGGYTKKYSQDCWVTNAQLANECGISARSVAEAINQLRDHKLIITTLGMYKNKKIRYIKVIYEPLNTLESAKSAQSDCANNSQSNSEETAQSESAKSASSECKICTMESAKSAQSTLYREKNNREEIELNKKTHSSSQSQTQFSIERVEKDALYLQNIFTEEIMKFAERGNVDARSVSSFTESEKWLKWNLEKGKLKYIKSEEQLRKLVSSWVLKTLENTQTTVQQSVTAQEDRDKRLSEAWAKMSPLS